MAAELGRRLLSERVVVGFDEVLNSLRVLARNEAIQDTSSSIFDHLLPDPQVQQQGQRPRFPVLEICSEESGAGKSQLTYLMIAIAILPDMHGSTILEGKNSTVIFLDTEGRFDVQRLVQVMTFYINSKSSEPPIEDKQDLMERCLRHVHVFQSQTMQALLDTLSGLRKYLLDSSAHFSSRRQVHSIILDSASSFYWQTRAEVDNQKVAALDSKPAMSAPSAPNAYAQLIARLRGLSQTFNCAIIATTQASTHRDPDTGESIIRTLPAPWANFPTMKLLVRREVVRKFALGISCEDALRERGVRQEEVQKGVFIAGIIGEGEMFRFTITRDGIDIVENEE